MNKMLGVLCLGLAACDSSLSGHRPLQRGMTEREVTEVRGNRVPDSIMMLTCGTATPTPFACKVYVYDTTLRGGQYSPHLSVVFENVRGQWVVLQWL